MDSLQALKSGHWPDPELILRQIDGIGEKYAKMLLHRGIDSLESIGRLPDLEIEAVTFKNSNWVFHDFIDCREETPFWFQCEEKLRLLSKYICLV